MAAVTRKMAGLKDEILVKVDEKFYEFTCNFYNRNQRSDKK